MVLAIAGERSGVGKTTVTLALLSYLTELGETVQSFKVGPDYIDPMFHGEVTGRPCRNLDPILTSPDYVRHCFNFHCQSADLALVEGVMGLFDGVAWPDAPAGSLPNDWASTAQIARLLGIPVLLVIDCRRLSGSVAAIATGYRNLDPRVKIAGLILNRVGSDRHRSLLQEALEPLKIPILGIFPRNAEIELRDRHLGLIPTAELSNFKEIRDRLAALARDCFAWPQLLPLLKTPRRGTITPQFPAMGEFTRSEPIRIGIARDRAFNFYYADNLDLLATLGAELVFWSPLRDRNLPDNCQGFYFGGGFPELFCAELAANNPLELALQHALAAGKPIYAECGGLMYLSEGIIDLEGQFWPMIGLIPTTIAMSPQLTLGYRQATCLQSSAIVSAGEQIWGHEFHHSRARDTPQQPLFRLRGLNGIETGEGWQRDRLHASYLHLHWGVRVQYAERFLKLARSVRSQSV